MLQPGDLFVCNDCDFKVPADNIGVEIMQQHLSEHRLERYRTKREEESSDTSLSDDMGS